MVFIDHLQRTENCCSQFQLHLITEVFKGHMTVLCIAFTVKSLCHCTSSVLKVMPQFTLVAPRRGRSISLLDNRKQCVNRV